MKTSSWIAVALLSLLAVRAGRSCSRTNRPWRFATFNIEDFPKDDRQVRGAFDEIGGLDASFVAVQEILDPALFERTARARLGERWHFVVEPDAALAHPAHHLGVLYDGAAWSYVSSMLHDETRLGARHKAVLEVRLRSREGAIVRVLVVHLKSGGDGREIRARQYVALDGIVREAQRSGEPVVLLGDFNATEDDGDRADLAHLAADTGLTWATEPLACSAFWDRDDGCPRSRLDHVLMSAKPARVEAGGACATEGCDRQDSCPLYVDQISDHCPVVIEVAP